MLKSEKKALQFAYDLLRGCYQGQPLAYVHATVPKDLRGEAEASPAPWVEPDRDPTRPYLNEAVFTELVMKGYLECQMFEPGPVWLYRLSRDGCAKLGWKWPKHNVYPLTLKDEQRTHLMKIFKRPSENGQKPPRYKLSVDANRFRRSNDWRKR